MTRLAILVVTGLAMLAAAPTASAATCSDYPNQAAAQRAADTRDADGDGIYCESLPCPCAGRRERGSGDRSEPNRTPRRGRRDGDRGQGAGRQPRPKTQVIDARITEVIDGDTVRVRAYRAKKRTYTVRLLGIDTPETRSPRVPRECGGREATANLLRLSFTTPEDSDGDILLDRKGGEGARVTLTTDPTQDLVDSFGRLLAYVETAEGEQLEREQLRAGLAKVFVFDRPFRRLRGFQQSERTAHRRKAGVWGLCGGDFDRPAG